MTMSQRLFCATTALAAWCCLVSPTLAIEPEVRDSARIFTSRGVSDANQILRDIKKTSKVDVVVETFDGIPSDRQQEAKSQNIDTFVTNWAKDRARTIGVKGIYVLICRNPNKLAAIDNLVDRQFSDSNLREMRGRMIEQFKDKKWDDGLLMGLRYARDTLGQQIRKTTTTAAPTSNNRNSAAPADEGGWSWMGILLAVGAGLLVLWLVVGLFRAFTGGGAGAGGGGGYGGGGGGGGGGFMTSMLGGLFGAAAGMWLYNSFFSPPHTPPMGGGDYSGGNAGPETTGDYSGGTDDIGGSSGGDYSGGGGDWGGGGGGDWGGGGDVGGGGDWGGGGGDF